ncbi:MAG: acyl-ACP--UDP-N-acetylglucosamine O-acyltransferase [Thermoanaerobaculia bacterium]
MSEIHATAVIDPEARLGEGVRVGPYAVIGGDVEIGAGTTIGPHAVIHSHVRLGEGNAIHAHAVLGDLPQDVAFGGEPTRLEIGDRNILRENVTVHRASKPDRLTRVGSDCFLMAGAHVAHDCQVGDGVILTNNVLLAGVVTVGDGANLGGAAVVHQFCRIGELAMVGGFGGVAQDVLPYAMVHGIPACHFRLNTIGLRRAGIKGERYGALETAFRTLRAGDRKLTGSPDTPEVCHLREWLAAPSKRGIAAWTRPRSGR